MTTPAPPPSDDEVTAALDRLRAHALLAYIEATANGVPEGQARVELRLTDVDPADLEIIAARAPELGKD